MLLGLLYKHLRLPKSSTINSTSIPKNMVLVQFGNQMPIKFPFLSSTATVANVLLNLIWEDVYGYF